MPDAIDEPAVVAALDVHVDRVISGGRWCDAEAEGFYRAVVYSGGFEEVYHHLHLQLVRVDAEARGLTVVATVPVAETQGAAMVVSDLTLVGTRGAECGEAIVSARILRWAGEGNRVERMQLRVDARGRYTVSGTPP